MIQILLSFRFFKSLPDIYNDLFKPGNLFFRKRDIAGSGDKVYSDDTAHGNDGSDHRRSERESFL